jgi:salicylate hydroxylase
MLPFLGQGANMAIEDACVLARCLKTFRSNPVMALQRYETARRQRTTDIVHRSAAMAGTFHNDKLRDSKEGADSISSQWDPEKIRTRYDSIYHYNALTVEI